ncbi:hypothetical protein [Aquimarina celericrescens]|uniref:Uncharacterized protein n=1 Tax=Aquimarina celericrescens TaxID=1964542 RepID=A0ABW5B1I9_9FLAO
MKNLKINDVKIISKSQQKFISGSFNQDHFDCIWTCGAMYGSDAEAEYRCVARCARFL